MLYFTGAPPERADDPCSRSYEAVAEPTDDAMVVTLHPLVGPQPRGGCPDIGYERSVTVDLPEPVRSRPIVDGFSGRRRSVSGAARLLQPSWLPPGSRLSHEYVESETDSYIDTREWTTDRHPDQRLLVEQGAVDEVGRPGFDPVVLDRPSVRGTAATVWKTRGFDDLVCVTWAEGAIGHRICSSGTPGELLPDDVLIRVADGLCDHDSRRARP